jgi:glycosyltransferase involved in cell wall biosynthesis
MKVLILANIFPLVNNPTRGIFLTNRLKYYNKFKIDYDAYIVRFKESKIFSYIKKILHKELVTSEKIINILDGVLYSDPEIKITLLDTIIKKNFNTYLSKKYAKKISKDIFKYDIIHAHGMYGEIPAGLIAYYLWLKYKIPYIVTLHGSDINLEMPKKKELYRKVLENAKNNIFVSEKLLEKAMSYKYSGKNAIVIGNGYDPNIFFPINKDKIRKELNIYKKNYKYVGFVGNLKTIKRADKLPEIFKEIANEIPHTKFIIVGDGVLKKEIENKTKNLDVLFTGKITQKDVAKYMNAMDIMIIPSRDEGFGTVIIEAQACGTAVVGSDVGGIPEAIGFEHYIVSDGDNFEKRFAKKIINILKIGYNSEELISRAKKYTWENIVKKEIEVYKNIKL